MKKITRFYFLIFTVIASVSIFSFRQSAAPAAALTGAWHWQAGTEEHTVSFVDDYCVFAAFDKQQKKFNYTWGGPFKVVDKNIVVQVQFNTQKKELVGTTFSFAHQWKGEQLVAAFADKQQTWKKLDDGNAPLAGVWRISGRKNGEMINEMPLGARRTLKILTGTRFQWAAINIDTKEFFGTGGGRYSFENGKYTEQIEFFSRDSTRVGASLSFDGKLENGAWHHSGMSSRGEPIYEIWKHLNQ